MYPYSRKFEMERCVKELIQLEVPAVQATESCKEIYKNPQTPEVYSVN